MMRFKDLLSTPMQLLALTLAVIATSCEDPSSIIGNEYLPNEQQTTIGRLEAAVGSFTTRHKLDNDISMTYQSTGALGFESSTEFGLRRSGFISRFRSSYVLDDDVYGYEPILDSVLMYLTMTAYSGDTTQVVRYDVFELLNDDFIPEDEDEADDSIFEACGSDLVEAELAKEGVVGGRLFSFNFPDQDNGTYIASSYTKAMDITDAGYDFIDRLLLGGGDLDEDDYEIYDYDSEDFETYFKGLVIRPAVAADQNWTEGGSTFTFTYSSAGFGFYGRSRYPENPTLIKDTIGMTYTFRDSYSSLYYFTANLIERDYTGSLMADLGETEVMVIEGFGGTISEITLEQSLFEQFEAEIESAETIGSDFKSIFFNTARLRIYLEDATGYDGYTIADQDALDNLNFLPTRLGMYETYSTFLDDDDYWEMETITDYNYSTESSGSISTIGGYLNRVNGCYVMDIPLVMQEMWSEYQDWKDSGEAWSTVDWNTILLAPLIDNLYTPKVLKLQGTATTAGAPMTLEVTYTLFKEE